MKQVNANLSCLNAFKQVNFGNDDAIVQLSDKGMRSTAAWNKANIFRWIRTGETKERNNAIRAELLRSLGSAFGLEGPKINENGRMVFSKAYMDELESILGPAFKRDNFGVSDKGGEVTSGKPLTERRIKCILNQAALKARTQGFDADAYHVKTDAMIAEASKLKGKDADDGKAICKVATTVKKMINFLKNDLNDLVVENPGHDFYDSDFDDPDSKNAVKFMMLVPKSDIPESDKGKPMYGEWTGPQGKGRVLCEQNGKVGLAFTKDDLIAFLQSKYNFTLHLENIKRGGEPVRETSDEFPSEFKNYVTSLLESFVTSAVNGYLETEDKPEARKDLISLFKDSHICVEGFAGELMSFMARHELGALEGVDVSVADHDQNTSLLECMAREAQNLELGRKGNNELGWLDYYPVFVDKLEGQFRMVADENGEMKLTKVSIDHINALKGQLRDILCFED